jgi:flagellar assembly factor FliW
MQGTNDRTTTGGEPEEIVFPNGILGFEEYVRFLLIGDDQTYPAWALQSAEDSWVSFTMVDPLAFFPDYSARLSDADKTVLHFEPGDTLQVLCVVSVPENPNAATANLLAPIVINRRTNLGRQVVLSDSAYSVRQRLFVEAP